MFLKSKRLEYFYNCEKLELNPDDDFTLDDVFDKQDELLSKEGANELSINMAAGYFLKYFKHINKWKKTPKYAQEKEDYNKKLEAIENYSYPGSYSSGKKGDFLD